MTAAARVEAIRRLGINRSPDDIPTLTAALHDPRPAVRAMACRAIGWQRTPSLADPLAARLDDPIPAVREQALRAIGLCLGRDLAPAPITAALVQRLTDKDDAVRAAAARICGWIGAVEAADAIRERLADDPSDAVRAEAAHAAARLGDDGAIPALVAALTARHSGLRHQAARALSALHAEGSSGALAACLTDPDAEVRAAALRGMMRLSPSLGPLLDALLDINPGVRATAAILIGQRPPCAASTAALSAAAASERHTESRHHILRALVAHGAAQPRGSNQAPGPAEPSLA